MRLFARILGTLMIVAGVGMLAWAVTVWQWQDPFTSFYTRWKQQQLADGFDQRLASYRPARVPERVSLAALQRQVRTAAARYRANARRGEPIGRIKVPRLGLNMIIVEGTDTETLKRGPGRERSTYMPGQGHLVYIAGHRTTYSAPFSRIDALKRGDPVTIELPYATFRYRITRSVIVQADDISRLKTPGYELLALQACHPRFFASQRYIAYARPIAVEPRGGRRYTLARAATS